MKKLVVLASLALVSNAFAAKWNKANNPSYFNSIAKNKMNPAFADLPLVGNLVDDRFGWSESYWPSRRGGIAFRWNHPDPQPFTYKLHTKEEVMQMSEAQIGQLSPAELYDLAMGDYRYSLTKKVLGTYNPQNLWWEGICHGWAQAASNYAEPNKVVITNKDGIKIPLGSSDVKGLISMHDAYNSKGLYVRVGARCKVDGKVPGEALSPDKVTTFPSKKDAEKPECSDVNAGAFHIVLASMIGINSQGFVADVDRFNDVWNQPITGYSSTIVGEVPLNSTDLKNGVDRKIQLKTTMIFGEELEFFSEKSAAEGHVGFVSKDPVTGTPSQTFKDRQYEYVLELNKDGDIVGGEWISESRPDMLWMKAKDVSFRNGKFPLSGLNQIYRPVTH